MNEGQISIILKTLPKSPGVYRFYDKDDNILYVGKAKNLKSRVSSYFRTQHNSARLRIMVKKIERIETIVTNTELEALLLENNMIKNLKPRYNMQLKDDKSYPFIAITDEPFPRIFLTRNRHIHNAEYYGPYASVRTAKSLLELMHKIFPLRTCKLNLSEKKIKNGNYKVCLEYHLKKCKGPCVGLINEIEYDHYINLARDIIKGKTKIVENFLYDKMQKEAENLNFEEAHQWKIKWEKLKSYSSRSIIVTTQENNLDAINLIENDNEAYISAIRVQNGSIVNSIIFHIEKKLNETSEELLLYAIGELYDQWDGLQPELIVPFPISFPIDNVHITVPKIGYKADLLKFCLRNAQERKTENDKRRAITDSNKYINQLLEKVKSDLHLPTLPKRIECFDNSNIQGTYPVSSCVVFIDGKPAKSEYRIFNVKTVKGINDFATMHEVVYRRYKRQTEENKPLPDLIIIDGGKGQLHSAYDALEKLGLENIPIIGIAKKLEEIYKPHDPIPLNIDKKSPTLKLIQRARDEAHRFGITHHRRLRSKDIIKTQLVDIKGIGPKTATKLLEHFGSVENIKKAKDEEIETLIGKAKLKILREALQDKD
ncbi:MAG TPA: excinuclease ABC subunit UvrC [Bacteroidales bacterium]|nr:excinuclease ABC subunit UvrC [Bacteroidales bacterium]